MHSFKLAYWDNKEDRCHIYPVRPMQCRTYPYWDELVRSRAAWQRESCCCEGIERGPVVARSHIERQLLCKIKRKPLINHSSSASPPIDPVWPLSTVTPGRR